MTPPTPFEKESIPTSKNARMSPVLPETPSISPPPDVASPTGNRHNKRQRISDLPKTPPEKEQGATVLAKTQLYLDFGQSSFGQQTICPMCNMLYVHGVEEDVLNHRKICESYNLGVPFAGGWKTERLVGSFADGGRIVEVRPTDPTHHRRKVTDVKRIVDQELGFAQRLHSHNREKDGEFSLNGKTAFLYVFQKRVAGFCTAEVIKKAYKLYIVNSALEGKGTNECHRQFPHQHTSRSTKSYPAMLGIHQIWCHRSYRKGGIGTRLIDAARSRI
eukprot:3868273-Ditylum_brightwellii.AAC.1